MSLVDYSTYFRKFQKIMPMGYNLGGNFSPGHLTLTASSYNTYQTLSVTGDKPYAVMAELRKLIRRDMKITQAAEAMCLALGLNPYLIGHYPLGSVSPGIRTDYGNGVYIGAAAAETRRMIDWIKPHAAMMAGAFEILSQLHNS